MNGLVGLIAPAWAVLVVGIAWRCRPRPLGRWLFPQSGPPTSGGRPLPTSRWTSSAPVADAGPSIVKRLGSLVTSRLNFLRRAAPTRVGWATVIVAVVAAASITAALVLAIAFVIVHLLADRRRRSSAARQLLEQLSAIVEILRIAVGGGLGVRGSIEVTVANVPADRDAGLGCVVEDLNRGVTLDAALDNWATQVGRPAPELSAVLSSADRNGVSISVALEHLATDLRRRRRRQAEERARRLPVTMLVPLVTCVLPAFALVTVVPMLVVGIEGVINPP